MNPRRKEVIVEDIQKLSGETNLPDFVSKLSVNQLQELRQLVEKANRVGTPEKRPSE
jgi:hypothetical protein